MTIMVEVMDDPDHPEGGHALVLFRDVAHPGTPVTLVIEPLTEGFEYRGPRRLETAGRVTPDGFEVAVGPEVTSALPPGIAMSLGLAGSGLEADVRWPTLAQKAAEPRRQVLKAPARRVVVTGGATPRVPPSPPKSRPPPQDPPKPPEAPPKPPEEPARDPGTGEHAASQAAADRAPAGASGAAGAALAPPRGETPPDPPKARTPGPGGAPAGWRTGSVAAAALFAFLAGAGGVGGVWLSRPAPTPPAAPGPAALPSPYDMLNELSDRSPRGIHVDPREAKAFRLRGDKAETPQEARFWHGWATKSLITGKTSDAAATLSDLATDLARGSGASGQGDASALAAARFLWEMAALASDCAAMENIAAALSRDGQAGTDRQAAIWRDRASLCRAGAKTAR